MSYQAYRDRGLIGLPYFRSFAITPSNSVDLDEVPRAIVIGGAGNVAMVLAGDNADLNYTVGGYSINQSTQDPSALEVVVVDTTPSIAAGFVAITGYSTWGPTVGDLFEIVDISAGAGTYTTVNSFEVVTAVKSYGLSVLGGGGDETIRVKSEMSNFSWVPTTNLVEQELYPTDRVVFTPTVNVPLQVAPVRILSTLTTATGIRGLV